MTASELWTGILGALTLLALITNQLVTIARPYGGLIKWIRHRKEIKDQADEKAKSFELTIKEISENTTDTNAQVKGLRADVDVLIRHDMIQEAEISRSNVDRMMHTEALELLLEHSRTGNATGRMEEMQNRLRRWQRELASRPYGDEYNKLLPDGDHDIAWWRQKEVETNGPN